MLSFYSIVFGSHLLLLDLSIKTKETNFNFIVNPQPYWRFWIFLLQFFLSENVATPGGRFAWFQYLSPLMLLTPGVTRNV